MWILLSIIFTLSAMAFGPQERLPNVKILKVLPGNVVLLDRGLEDGLLRNDHIKISNNVEGYAARAICLKASASISYWKLYRVPNAEAFSMDNTYVISGLADKEIPMPEAKIRNIHHEILEAEKKKTTRADPFAIKRDLPEKLTERDLIQAVGPEKRRLFIEEAINHEQMKRDLEDYRFSIYASPFTRQSINDSENLRYGIRGGNIGSRYRLLTQYDQQRSKMKDPQTKESVSTSSTNGQAQFVVHRLKKQMSSLSLVNYNSTRFSSLGTPESHWQLGPLGFTWHWYESKTWEYVDFSYIPLYDTRTTQIVEPNGDKSRDKTNGIRHGFRLALKTSLNERVGLENLLWVRPWQDLASWRIEGDDLNLVNDFKMIFNISGNFFFDYNFIYQRDKLWKKLNGLPEDNTINSINLRYDFDV